MELKLNITSLFLVTYTLIVIVLLVVLIEFAEAATEFSYILFYLALLLLPAYIAVFLVTRIDILVPIIICIVGTVPTAILFLPLVIFPLGTLVACILIAGTTDGPYETVPEPSPEDLPDTVECKICGEENPIGREYCGSCGSTLMMECLNCGNEAPRSAMFCPYCGNRLNDDEE